MAFEWIDQQAPLVALCEELRAEPFITVDTEFHRERTYFAQLALVQVAGAGRVACIDPLANLDLAPLDALMLDPGVRKVVHAGRQDLEIFFQRTGEVPGPLFDTQVAAALLGLGDQVGYGALVAQVLGEDLPKLHGRTDWMRRPLDRDVLEYAAADVTWLREVHAKLDERLVGLSRRTWLDEEQARLFSPESFAPADEEAWTRVKGTGRLKAKERAVARALAAWREARARELDRPRQRVLTDDALVDLSRQQPTSVEAMERLRALDPAVRKREGKRLVEVIREAAESDERSWPASLDRGAPSPVDNALIDALSAVLSVRAREASMSPRMLAGRGDLERVARGERDVPVLEGWRGELAGESLLAFLAGNARLEALAGELRLFPGGGPPPPRALPLTALRAGPRGR